MSSETSYSVLEDPLFSVRYIDGERDSCALPEVYRALTRDEITSFEALQAHQKQAWYCFLVQTAAMALDDEGLEDPPDDARTWQDLLVDLGQSSEETWCLLVEDWSKPAFFQPPIPEGSPEEAGYDDRLETPDRLDMLITSKNHDLKRTRIQHPRKEHWIYSLINLQTMEGYGGAGNYGIARMNGGYSNRPFLGVTTELSPGGRFNRDLKVLLDLSSSNRNAGPQFDSQGVNLLWNLPWNGSKDDRLSPEDCHPMFVEICRRIRFCNKREEKFDCLRTTTKDYRIQGVRDLNGVLGDPWVPVNESSDPKALSLSGRGFDYERLQELWLGDDYDEPPALEFLENEKDGGYLIATGLARGQSKTEGLYRRIVPVPKHAARFFTGDESRRKKLGDRAQQRVDIAGDVQRKVLYPSVLNLLQAGNDDADPIDNFDDIDCLDQFDGAVDRRFFDDLWSSIEKDEEEARLRWQKTLFELVRDIFDEAIERLPVPSVRRYRAISEAESIFWARVNDVLPLALEEMQGDSEQPEGTGHGE